MPTPVLKIKSVAKKPKKLAKELERRLISISKKKVGPLHWKALALEVRSPGGKLLGGLFGETFWGWMFIETLWVHPSIQRRSLGKELVLRAESLAIKRGCRYANVSSFSFQAPGFYEKQGYRTLVHLKDFPKGHSWSNLTKRLKTH